MAQTKVDSGLSLTKKVKVIVVQREEGILRCISNAVNACLLGAKQKRITLYYSGIISQNSSPAIGFLNKVLLFVYDDFSWDCILQVQMP